MRRVGSAGWICLAGALSFACGTGDGGTSPQSVEVEEDAGTGGDAGGRVGPEEPLPPGSGDGGTIPGTPDGGDGGPPESNFDGGEPPPPPPLGGFGPWPDEPVVDFSDRYGVGTPQSISVDEAYNIWLLDRDRIGVLRPGATAPVWTTGVGQAAGGFGPSKRALASTVICGGASGRAYVGYAAAPVNGPFIFSPDGCEFPGYTDCDPLRFSSEAYADYLKGDVDVVRLQEDGTVVLEEHLQRTPGPDGVYRGPQDIGIRNTNDHHFDEDNTVYSCTRVMRGRDRGEVYLGTNHGVTRVKGLEYNSHRHPVWFKEVCDEGGCKKSQRAGLNYALGIAQNGDVLIGNDWNVGIVTPNPDFRTWDNTSQTVNPEKLNGFVSALGSVEDMDFWRGFQQTTDGRYFAGSRDFGVWQIEPINRNEERSTKLSGLPTDSITSLAATDDGSLFIGTEGSGLWRLPPGAGAAPARVSDVEGSTVRELVYDPTVSPAMLYVLTGSGLTVLRGH